MDETATVMNARPVRWMNGVTWWLDNRNCPQDRRSKWWDPRSLPLPCPPLLVLPRAIEFGAGPF